MRLLLDTHVAIWAVSNSKGLPQNISAMLSDAGNVLYVSAVSILEIAIKISAGSRNPPPFSSSEAIGHFRQLGSLVLDVTAEHAAGVERLPLLHRDPFDRLLVSQALAEPLRLVTHEAKVAAYSNSFILF